MVFKDLREILQKEFKGIYFTPPLLLIYIYNRYGTNVKRIPKIKSIFEIILDSLSDKILIILLIAATVSMALGIYQDPSHGWIDGLSIYLAVIAIVSITSSNNWVKEK